MARKRFEHLLEELSLAAGRVIPRYPLWLRLSELGATPESLTREEAVRFCNDELEDFLDEHAIALTGRAKRQLRRQVAQFDATHPSPSEWMEKMGVSVE